MLLPYNYSVQLTELQLFFLLNCYYFVISYRQDFSLIQQAIVILAIFPAILLMTIL